MKLQNILLTACLLVFFTVSGWAQEAPENWFNLDMEADGVPGVSTEKLYDEVLKNAEGKTVIVAVLDGGIDIEHEDLADIIWTNEDEIAGNGIDDDNNGYVDDVHGWNFIGGKDGENVHYDNLEITRLFRKYDKMFADADPEDLSKKEKEQYEQYQFFKEELQKNRDKYEENALLYGSMFDAVTQLKKEIDKEEITKKDLEEFESEDAMLGRAAAVMQGLLEQGGTFNEILGELEEAADYYGKYYDYYYNPDFNPRSIVGDNYSDPKDANYGNSDVEGPDASHGTHVAGIIAAVRTNDLGIKGVANNVVIMPVRVVPDGDERDKDVANAIRYAVDNGASIINMSFGKGYSWNKKVVDKAVKHARKKDVLLVHAAGNDGKENFTDNNFPNDKFEKKGWFGPKKADNWIEVGAVNWVGGENLAASFSNWSNVNVDVFAPGVDVLSTTPDDNYEPYPGTSMASPMVAGVAAILRSYFPDLSAEEVKSIIEDSAIDSSDSVAQPGSGEMVPFSSLSTSGGLLNAYQAVMLAIQRTGKNIVSNSSTASR